MLTIMQSQPRPDEIAMAKDERLCPRCSPRYARQTRDRMDISFNTPRDDEGIGGDIGLCHNCGFAF